MSWGTRGVPIRGLSSHLLVCVRVQLQKFSVFFFCPTANKRAAKGGDVGVTVEYIYYLFLKGSLLAAAVAVATGD